MSAVEVALRPRARPRRARPAVRSAGGLPPAGSARARAGAPVRCPIDARQAALNVRQNTHGASRNVEAVLLTAQQQHLRHLRRLQNVSGRGAGLRRANVGPRLTKGGRAARLDRIVGASSCRGSRALQTPSHNVPARPRTRADAAPGGADRGDARGVAGEAGRRGAAPRTARGGDQGAPAAARRAEPRGRGAQRGRAGRGQARAGDVAVGHRRQVGRRQGAHGEGRRRGAPRAP